MVVQQTLRYLAEAEYPEPVEIACGVSRIGTSSYDIVQALFQRGRCVGLCDAVLVNTGLNGAEPLPLRLREAFDRALIAETAD
jgi:acyl-CoA thioester hydrolase